MHSVRLSGLLVLSLISFTFAISSKSLDSRGVLSDIKYIKCEVCAQVAKAATETVQQLDQKHLTELQTLDIIETICDPSSPNARWMTTIDLVERLGKLRLVPQEGEQDCARECQTIRLACTAVLDGYETDLAEKLYAMRKRGDIDVTEIESWLCEKRKGLTGACNIKPPLLAKDREKGPEFKKKDPKEVDMDKLMAEMRQMNGGKDLNMDMFTNKQMKGGMPGMDDDDDDDDDDEDDEDDEDDDDVEYDDEESEHVEKEEGMDAQDASSLDDTSLGDTASEALGGMQAPDVGTEHSKKLEAETGSDEL